MNTEVFGYHLMINASACDKSVITSKEKIEDFSSKLVEAIDMTAYGPPQVIHFAAHNPKAGGFTLIQLIETSNIAGHFVDDSGNAFVDIFSCKDFDPKVALDVFSEHFRPQKLSHTFICREI